MQYFKFCGVLSGFSEWESNGLCCSFSRVVSCDGSNFTNTAWYHSPALKPLREQSPTSRAERRDDRVSQLGGFKGDKGRKIKLTAPSSI